MEHYSLTERQLYETLQTSPQGLTSEEAEKRLEKNGRNALREGKKKSLFSLFVAQFKDLMTVILMCAAFLSGVLAFLTADKSQLADTVILLFIILLNAVVGFLQQYRADSAIEKLKKMSVCRAKAVRDGRVVELDASLLVVGDVVELCEGDIIPADCRLLSADRLTADESALTGESRPTKKRTGTVTASALAERENTVHFSTFCVSGSGRGVVVATGMQTEMGKIADLLQKERPAQTPLDKTIAKLGKIITVTVFSVAILLFACGMIAQRVGFLDNLMSAVAVAVAAIPEGMGAVVTIILAMGVQKMARASAVVRKLSAVETLGNCTCICSDKTGTLTQNRMTVEEIACAFSDCEETPAQREAILTCIRACHSVKGRAGAYLGDRTEIALLEYADRQNASVQVQVLKVEPFSSERKRMSVAATANGKTRLFVKGGTEVVLSRCQKICTAHGVVPMSEADRRAVLERVKNYSERAMRVLAFAVGEFQGEMKEENLTFLGLAAMSDPPKAGAKEAVEACRRAGIKTVMITGDGADTAFAVARRLNIASKREEVLTGAELDELGEDEYRRRADRYTVYARVSPKHKTQIVKALQGKGEIVAMTGDGVNDAPSIRAADIGIAMGSGTDVTKNAADMVLSDDDFSTIGKAVEEGRNVFYNVKKTISFFLATNFAEVLSVLFVTLFLWKFEFLTSTQLLWINLITDSLPVLALGVERTEGVMNRPPVSAAEIFCAPSLVRMAVYGVALTLVAVGIYCYSLFAWGNGVASTIAFFVLSLSELFHAFNVRTETGTLGVKGFFANKTLLFTVLFGVAVNVMLAVVPVFRTAFSLVPLNGAQWGAVFGCSLLVLPVGWLYRLVCRGYRKRIKKSKRKNPVRENKI